MKLIKALRQFPQIGADLDADFRGFWMQANQSTLF
jgi:hypothetical protein